MGAATFQNAFCGIVHEDNYVQLYDLEVVGLVRNLVTAKVTEKTYRFKGLSYSDAHTSSASTTVTYPAGSNTSITVPLQSAFVDSSSGTKVFETRNVKVTRVPLSPRLWQVDVTVRDTDYYLNGVLMTFS